MNLSNKDLKYYFNNGVKRRIDERNQVKEYALSKVQQLLNYVHSLDARFDGDPTGSGIHVQRLKTKRADEFDCYLFVKVVSEHFRWTNYKERCYRFNSDVDLNSIEAMEAANLNLVSTPTVLSPPEKGFTFVSMGNNNNAESLLKYSNDLKFQGDIIPFLVKKVVKDLIQQAIRDLDMGEDMAFLLKTQRLVLTLMIPCDIGEVEQVTINTIPTIPLRMSFPTQVKWPRPFTYWPILDKKKNITQIGIDFTAEKPYDWRFSFEACEGELMNDIDSDGGCREQSLRIMVDLLEQYWVRGSKKPQLSSYHLKNIFFWECETHWRSVEWQQDKLSERIESMSRTLLRCIAKKEISQYFFSDVNLLSVENEDELATLQNERQNIVDFLAHPARFLLR